MASRLLHLAVAEKIIQQVEIKDKNRFKLGILLPDAYTKNVSKADSHLKILICNGTKKTYDLTKFKHEFKTELQKDELYLGYYLHLIRDLLFRQLVYKKYKWNPHIPGNIEHLHMDYCLINRYVIETYGLKSDIEKIEDFEKEKINSLYPFDVTTMLQELKKDFTEQYKGEIFFFTKDKADEFVEKAYALCMEEIIALQKKKAGLDEQVYAWDNKEIEK